MVNKIDLPQADPDEVAAEVADLLGERPERRPAHLREDRRRRARGARRDRRADPAAGGRSWLRRRARSIFDSSYDQYRGVVAFVRVVDGSFEAPGGARDDGRRARRFEAEELGFFSPARRRPTTLGAGEVGYVITGLKDVSGCASATRSPPCARPAAEPLPGYKDVKPMVFAGLFPTDSDDYPELRDALERLKLNDASLFYEPETSQALGFGFRCGFLGLLHMEIVRERLEREFDLDLLVTAPERRLPRHDAGRRGASRCTTRRRCRASSSDVEEPYVKASVIVPKEYVGTVMELCNERRGRFDHMEYLSRATRVQPALRAAAGRDRARLLRPAEVPHARATRASTTTSSGSARRTLVKRRHPARRRAGRRALPRSSTATRAYDARQALVERLREEIPRQMFDVADPGRDRLARHRARDGQGEAQGRARQVLRRRHHRASASCSRSRRRARSG